MQLNTDYLIAATSGCNIIYNNWPAKRRQHDTTFKLTTVILVGAVPQVALPVVFFVTV